MAGARSAQRLSQAPATSLQNLYNPDTAQQYTPGMPLPGTNLLQALISPGTSLKEGWAPRIGHITTSAATAKRRTNPMLATPTPSVKRKNPFVISQTPSTDLFGINIPA